MPKVSVIIPTYNRKGTLKTTLLSLSGQTFTDFEVVVADDGSTDGTHQMLKELSLPYPLKHIWQANSGRSAARNMGLEVARDGKGVDMKFDPAMVAEFQKGDFTGVEGIILRIVPLQSPFQVLGMEASPAHNELAQG